MQLNHELIVRSLGEVDDTVIAQILATGASVEELAEAQAWIVNDEPLLNAGKPLPAGRVSQVAEILKALQEETEDSERR